MITYILIGIAFMFLLEYFTNLNRFKKYSKTHSEYFKKFGFWERFMGITCWPIFLGVFLYGFLIEYFK